MWENVGQGQLFQRLQENPQSRAALRNAVQNVAQNFFNQNQGQVPPTLRMAPTPPPRADYTPVIIAALATVLAAVILTRKK